MDKFYRQVRWRKVRSRRLRIDKYVCKECSRYGKTKQATHVHHIFPIELYWELRYNILNLISLCTKCHNKMHNRVTNKITAKGKELQRRVKSMLFDSPPT